MKPLSKKEIAQEFRDFMNHDVPAFMDMYDNDHGYLIAEIFVITRKSSSVLDGSGEQGLGQEYCFPIAKVWQVGLAYNDETHQLLNWSGLESAANMNTTYTSPGVLPAHRYQPGQLLRLKDDDVKTVINPHWQAVERAKAPYNQGGTPMKQESAQPEKHLSNMRNRLGKRQFIPNPFEMDGEKFGRFAFCLESPHIMCGIDEGWARHFLLGDDVPDDAVVTEGEENRES